MQEEDVPPVTTDGLEEESTSTRTREALGLGDRNKTINLRRQRDKDREEVRRWLPVYEEYASERPKTRGDCIGGIRPCPWVGCHFNNFLDVKKDGPTSGQAIVFNFPNIEPDEVPPDRSCALDIADKGGSTLEDVALLTNLTRERIRQVQDKALRKLQEKPDLHQFTDGDEKPSEFKHVGASSNLRKKKADPQTASEYSNDAYDLSLGDGDAIEFLSNHPRAEELVTARAWRIYMRESVEKGFAKRKKTKREMEGLPDVPVEDRFAETNIKDDLSVRHNGGMAHKSDKTTAKTRSIRKKASEGGDEIYVTERQSRVQVVYELLKEKLGVIPNNLQISDYLTQTNRPTTVEEVTRDRAALVKMKLVEPAPRGRTAQATPKTEKKPKKRKKRDPRMKEGADEKTMRDAVKGVPLTISPTFRPVAATILAQMAALDIERAKLQSALDALS